MKKLFFFALVISLAQIACQRQSVTPVAGSFDGTWRMILVTDNASGTTTSKPSSIQGDVDIKFVSANTTVGSFTGQTPTNDINQGDYVLGSNQGITIPRMSMTKVAETSWGDLFVDHIRAAESYVFESRTLLMIRTTKLSLRFQKL